MTSFSECIPAVRMSVYDPADVVSPLWKLISPSYPNLAEKQCRKPYPRIQVLTVNTSLIRQFSLIRQYQSYSSKLVLFAHNQSYSRLQVLFVNISLIRQFRLISQCSLTRQHQSYLNTSLIREYKSSFSKPVFSATTVLSFYKSYQLMKSYPSKLVLSVRTVLSTRTV